MIAIICWIIKNDPKRVATKNLSEHLEDCQECSQNNHVPYCEKGFKLFRKYLAEK